MKTADLIGPALDWAVAKCESITCFGAPVYRTEAAEFLIMYSDDPDLHYSINWAQGGPIIERERLFLQPGPVWYAMRSDVNQPMLSRQSGPTSLIAAMRCYVASKLGDEVEIPDELK